MDSFVCELLGIDEINYRECICKYRDKIVFARDKYKELVLDDIKEKKNQIKKRIDYFKDIEELKESVIRELDEHENAKNRDYLDRIDKFRNY